MSGCSDTGTRSARPNRRRTASVVAVVIAAMFMALGGALDSPARADGLDPFCDSPSAPTSAQPTLAAGRFAGASMVVRGTDGDGNTASATYPPRLAIPDLFTGGSVHFDANRTNFSIASRSSADFSFGYGLRSSTASSPGPAGYLTGENPLRPLFVDNFGLTPDTASGREVAGAGLSLFVYHPQSAARHDLLGEFTVAVTMDEGGTAHDYNIKIGIDARGTVGAGAVFPTATRISLLFRKNTTVTSPGSRPERGWWGIAEELSYQEYPGITDANRPPVRISAEVTEVTSGVTAPTLESTQTWSKAPQDFAVGISDECTPAARGTDSQTSRLTWVRPSGPADATMRVTATSGAGRGVRGLDGFKFDATTVGVPHTTDVRFRQRFVSIDRSADVVPDLHLETLQSAALPPPGTAPDDPTVVSGDVAGLPEHSVVVGGDTALSKMEVLTCPGETDLVRLSVDYRLPVNAPPCGADSQRAPRRMRFVMKNWAAQDESGSAAVRTAAAELPRVPAAGPFVLVANRDRRGDDPAELGALSMVGAELEHVKHIVVDRTNPPGGGSHVLGMIETDGAPASPRPAPVLVHLDTRTSNDPAANGGSLVDLDGRIGQVPTYAKFEVTADPHGGTPVRARWDADAAVHAEADVEYVGPRRGRDDVDVMRARVVTGPDGELSQRIVVEYRDSGGDKSIAVDADAPMRLRTRAELSTPNDRAASEPTAQLVRAETTSAHLQARWRSGRDGLEAVHAETCTDCDTAAGVPVGIVYAAGTVADLGTPATPVADPVDALPAELAVPADLTSGPSPAFRPLWVLGESTAGVRLVEFPGKVSTKTDLRMRLSNLNRVDYSLVGPSGDRRTRVCTDVGAGGSPFHIGAFREDQGSGGAPGSATAADAYLDSLPASFAAEIGAEPFVERTGSGRRLLAVRADPDIYGADGSCDPDRVQMGEEPDDAEWRPKLVFEARSGAVDPAGLSLLRDAAPPRPHGARETPGADVNVVLGQDADVVDVAGRLSVPRRLDVDVPTLVECDAATAGTMPGPCPMPVYERDDSTRMSLSYQSTLARLGGLDLTVRNAGADARFDHGSYVSGAATDLTAHVAALPGSAYAQFGIGGNTRLPATDLSVELWPTAKYKVEVPLEDVLVEYTDHLRPGYRGSWQTTPSAIDPGNVVANYRANLHDVGEVVDVKVNATGVESASLPAGVEDSARAWCRSRGRGFDTSRPAGPVYVHADVDVNRSDLIELNVRNQADHTGGASADAVVDVASRAPLSGTVDAKIALQQAMHSEISTPVGSVDAGFCIDADLPVHAELTDLTGLTLQQSGAAVSVQVPVLEAMMAAGTGRDPIRGSIGEDVVTAEPGRPTRRMAGAWFKTYLAEFDPPPFYMSWSADETGGQNCDDLTPCSAYLFQEPPRGHTGVWRDIGIVPLAPMPGTADDCTRGDHWQDTCQYPVGRLPILAGEFVNEFGYQPRRGPGGGLTDLRVSAQPWRLEFLADVLWAGIARDSMGTTTVPFSSDSYGERLYELVRRMSDLDAVTATRPQLAPVPPSTHTYVSEQVMCNDPGRLEGAGREATAPVTLADGTSVHVWFHDACDETSFVLLPYTNWKIRPDVRIVANYPDGSVRWVRPLISYDGASWPYEETELYWGDGLDNPPDDRTEGVRFAVAPNGTSVQARAYVRGLDGVEWDRTYRFDISGNGGPVRNDSLVGVNASGQVAGDTAQQVTASNHTPVTVTLRSPLADCRGGCAGRTIYFGDGGSEVRAGTAGTEVTAFEHTYDGVGTYTAVVVTYDSIGRPTDAVPIRVDVT